MAATLDRVKTEASVQYVDHNLLRIDNLNADDHLFLESESLLTPAAGSLGTLAIGAGGLNVALALIRRNVSTSRRSRVMNIGRRIWAIAEGYIPTQSVSNERPLISHETACLLNASDADADVTITLFFTNREPAGPYHVQVPARRTLHLRFNDLTDPEPVPRDTDYASVFQSNTPIVIQHTRLDSRNPNIALLSTIAFAGSSD